METGSRRLTAAAEDYFTALRRIRASGGATGERSSYAPLAALLDAVGATLKPPLPLPGVGGGSRPRRARQAGDAGAGRPEADHIKDEWAALHRFRLKFRSFRDL